MLQLGHPNCSSSPSSPSRHRPSPPSPQLLSPSPPFPTMEEDYYDGDSDLYDDDGDFPPRRTTAAAFTRPPLYLARSAALLSLFFFFVRQKVMDLDVEFFFGVREKREVLIGFCIDFCDWYMVLWMEWLLKRWCRQACNDEEVYIVVCISATTSDLPRSLLFAVALPGAWYIGGDAVEGWVLLMRVFGDDFYACFYQSVFVVCAWLLMEMSFLCAI